MRNRGDGGDPWCVPKRAAQNGPARRMRRGDRRHRCGTKTTARSCHRAAKDVFELTSENDEMRRRHGRAESHAAAMAFGNDSGTERREFSAQFLLSLSN